MEVLAIVSLALPAKKLCVLVVYDEQFTRQNKEFTLQDLIDKTIKWADDRNLLDGSTPAKQIQKTAEELMELAVAIGKDEMLNALMLQINPDKGKMLVEEVGEELADAVGDVLVTLIIVAKQCGLDINDCLQKAYEEIKDRQGRMVNGKFVKES